MKTEKSPVLVLFGGDWTDCSDKDPYWWTAWVCHRYLYELFDISTAKQIVLVLSTEWSKDCYRVERGFPYIYIFGADWSKRYYPYPSIRDLIIDFADNQPKGVAIYASVKIIE